MKIKFHAMFVFSLVSVLLLFLGTALAKTDDLDLEQLVRGSRWSLLVDQSVDQWYSRAKNEIVRRETEYRRSKHRDLNEFLKTLPEPTAGASFEGKTFPSIAASVTTCGTAVTFQIKNYLNESIFGEYEMGSGKLGQALREIRDKTKEIVVVKDDFNNPEANLKYTVGNTTVEFNLYFLLRENQATRMTLAAGDSSSKYLFTSATLKNILPIDFSKVEEKFQLITYQNQYNQELVENSRGIYIRLTSRLALPRRLAITVEIFRYEEEIF